MLRKLESEADAQWLFDSRRWRAANGPFPLPALPAGWRCLALVLSLTLTSPLWDFL